MIAGIATGTKSSSCTPIGHPQSAAAGRAERNALLLGHPAGHVVVLDLCIRPARDDIWVDGGPRGLPHLQGYGRRGPEASIWRTNFRYFLCRTYIPRTTLKSR